MEELPRKRRKSPIEVEAQKKALSEVNPVHFSLRPPTVRRNFNDSVSNNTK